MALDGNSGAVDCWGELFGLPGIYCVGTSVLPVSAVNHPTYLALALGLKTIDRVNVSLKK